MKANFAVIVLGIYMLVVGFLGLVKTGSFSPLYINGTMGAVTVWMGWLLGTGMKSARNAALTWLSINVAVLGYMAFGRVFSQAANGSQSILLTGSMAALSVLAFFLVLRTNPRQWISNHRR